MYLEKLIVQLENGRELSLSGFTDEERLMVGIDPLVEGTKYEGKRVSNDYYNSLFPIGNIVTFKYRGLSNENIPQEARYFRTAQV